MPRLYVPQETRPSEPHVENRVAAAPETVAQLVGAGFEVEIESGAGLGAGFTDAAFEAAGAGIVPAGNAGAAALRRADVVFKVREPSAAEVDQLRPGALLFAPLDPFRHLPLVRRLAGRGVTAFAMDRRPPGPGDLPVAEPGDESRLYARTLRDLLMLCFVDGELRVDPGIEAIAGALLLHAGEIRDPAIAALLADTAIRA